MSRGERLTLILWSAITLLAVVAMWAPAIVTLLILLMITIPIALLIEAMPTIWLYLTPVLLAYLVLRLVPGIGAWMRMAGAGVVLVLVGTAGVMVPEMANRETVRLAAALVAQDGGTVPRIPTGASVTHLIDRELVEMKCWDECQRFLFTGTAQSFTEGTLEALAKPDASPVALMAHKMVPLAQGCDNRQLQAAYADRVEVGDRRPPPHLWDKLPQLREQRLCFRSDPTRDARADFLLVDIYNTAAVRRWHGVLDLRLHSIEPFRRREIHRSDKGRLVPVLRQTQVRYQPLAVPLRIRTPSVFDTYRPGGWSTAKVVTLGGEQPVGLGRWASNDFRVTGL